MICFSTQMQDQKFHRSQYRQIQAENIHQCQQSYFFPSKIFPSQYQIIESIFPFLSNFPSGNVIFNMFGKDTTETILFLSDHSDLHLLSSPLMHTQTNAVVVTQLRKIFLYFIQHQQSDSTRYINNTLYMSSVIWSVIII